MAPMAMQMRATPTPKAALAPALKLSPRASVSCESTVELEVVAFASARAVKRRVVEGGWFGASVAASPAVRGSSRVRRLRDTRKVSLLSRQSPDAELRSNQQGSSDDEKFRRTEALPLNGRTLSTLNSERKKAESVSRIAQQLCRGGGAQKGVERKREAGGMRGGREWRVGFRVTLATGRWWKGGGWRVEDGGWTRGRH